MSEAVKSVVATECDDVDDGNRMHLEARVLIEIVDTLKPLDEEARVRLPHSTGLNATEDRF